MTRHLVIDCFASSPHPIFKSRAYDETGSGYSRRSDMIRALVDLGHNHTPQPQLLAILEVFETRGEGLVNYNNLVVTKHTTTRYLLPPCLPSSQPSSPPPSYCCPALTPSTVITLSLLFTLLTP